MALRDVLQVIRPQGGFSADGIADQEQLRLVRQEATDLGLRVTLGAADGRATSLAELLPVLVAAQSFCEGRGEVARGARVEPAQVDELLSLTVALGQLDTAAQTLEEAARTGALLLSADLTAKNDAIGDRAAEKIADEAVPLSDRRALKAAFGSVALWQRDEQTAATSRRERVALHKARTEAAIGASEKEVETALQVLRARTLKGTGALNKLGRRKQGGQP